MVLVALEYHDVIADGDFDSSGFSGGAAASYKLTGAKFETHLDALAALQTAIVVLRGGPALESRGVALTFDDGGRSALDVIAPALERRAWRGHFFVASDFLGSAGFLTGNELRNLVSRGHVVGSHSTTHPLRMATLSNATLRDEWRISKAKLEDVTGVELPVASVPGGALSRMVIDTAAEAGIRVLFTSEPVTTVMRRSGCSVVGRYTLRRDDPASLVAALCGSGSRARSAQWIAWHIKKLAKRLGGSAYLRLRERVFGE